MLGDMAHAPGDLTAVEATQAMAGFWDLGSSWDLGSLE